MSTKKRDDYLDLITPRGVAVYPKLDRPRRFDKKAGKSVDDPDGKYEIEIALDAADAAKLQKKLQDFAVEKGLKLKNVKNWPWKDEVDKETDEETGRVIFKFKAYGKRKDGSTNRIPHWKADGASRYDSDFRLTSGSIIKIAGSAKCFTELGGGVSLQVNSVQVIKYVEYEARNPGFGNEADEDDEDNEGSGEGFQNEDDGEDNSDPSDF